MRARPSSSDETGQREAVNVHDNQTLGFTSSGEETHFSFDYAADGKVSQLQFFRGGYITHRIFLHDCPMVVVCMSWHGPSSPEGTSAAQSWIDRYVGGSVRDKDTMPSLNY